MNTLAGVLGRRDSEINPVEISISLKSRKIADCTVCNLRHTLKPSSPHADLEIIRFLGSNSETEGAR